MIWLGSIDAAREIVKERSVFERESAVGMRLSAYLVSKAVVLFALVARPDAALRGDRAGLPPARRTDRRVPGDRSRCSC